MRATVAMTGEITLRGHVLPIGGLKEKILAARRAGIDTILCPKLNKKELDEVPAHLRRGMEIHLVETVDEVLSLALQPPPETKPQPGSKAPRALPEPAAAAGDGVVSPDDVRTTRVTSSALLGRREVPGPRVDGSLRPTELDLQPVEARFGCHGWLVAQDVTRLHQLQHRQKGLLQLRG